MADALRAARAATQVCSARLTFISLNKPGAA
jgi:hypothetical protein